MSSVIKSYKNKAAAATFDYDVERLRARLNHDLLKNRLVLGLSKLIAMADGRVETPASMKNIVDEVSNDWILAKQDIYDLHISLQKRDWLFDVLQLPFLRNMLQEEKTEISKILPGCPNVHLTNDNTESVMTALLVVDTVMANLQVEDGAPSITAIESALTEVRKFSDFISSLRLSI